MKIFLIEIGMPYDFEYSVFIKMYTLFLSFSIMRNRDQCKLTFFVTVFDIVFNINSNADKHYLFVLVLLSYL